MRLNKAKKTIYMILAIIISLSALTGCRKCISTETSIVQVKVIDEYYRPSYITTISTGKTITMISHPPTYKITVEYNNILYDISGSDVYYKYSNKIGEYVNGTLQIKKYDDGTEKYKIIGLE